MGSKSVSIQPQTFVKVKDYEEFLPGTSCVKTFRDIFVFFNR